MQKLLDVRASHSTQLILTAVAASAATFGAITAYDRYTRLEKRKHLSEDVLRNLDEDTNVSSGQLPPTEELIREQLARNYAFFGEEGMSKLRKGRVAIIGCGGVGSWAAVMLARSGVSYIRLVDFDYVTLSSLNRHATALLADVGTPKVNCVARTIHQFSKWTEVETHIDVWRKEEGSRFLEGVDWVIDAIDNITTKVDLLGYCHSHNIPVFSSMGAGAKCDPTRVHIADISETLYDPLARSVRRRLRAQYGVTGGIPVVYSSEVPGDVKLLPLPEDEFQKGNVKELGVFDDFRVRVLPVLGPLPSIFGLNIATFILCELAEKPIGNPLAIKYRRKLYDRLYRDLLNRESKLAGHQVNKLPLDEEDISVVFEDLYRGRSIVPPHVIPARPALVRWDPTKPLTLDNCAVMDHHEMDKHVKQCYPNAAAEDDRKTPIELWGEEVDAVARKRSEEAKRYLEWIL